MQTGLETTVSAQEIVARNELRKWQNHLLPLMKRMVVVLCIFFFFATLAQLVYLHTVIRQSPKIDLTPTLSALQPGKNQTAKDARSAAYLKSVIMLEENTMERRHHMGSVLLMSSIWIRYLGFSTGMILAFIGAVFILGKLQEGKSEVGTSLPMASVTLKSTSPGLVLVVMGSVLMALTIVMQHSIRVNDNSVYFNPGLAADVASDNETAPATGFDDTMPTTPPPH